MTDMIRNRKGLIAGMKETGKDISGIDIIKEIYRLIDDYARVDNETLSTIEEFDGMSKFVTIAELRFMEMYGAELTPSEKKINGQSLKDLKQLKESRDEDDWYED